MPEKYCTFSTRSGKYLVAEQIQILAGVRKVSPLSGLVILTDGGGGGSTVMEIREIRRYGADVNVNRREQHRAIGRRYDFHQRRPVGGRRLVGFEGERNLSQTGAGTNDDCGQQGAS